MTANRSIDTHLTIYRFGPDATFEGGLLGALERMQIGGKAKLLDALFVRHNAESGAWEAVDLGAGGGDATFASLLDFRLDSDRRRAITERTLTEHRGGVPRSLIEAVAAALGPGTAIMAILHTGEHVTVLDDAVARCGGRLVTSEPADARMLADVDLRLRVAVAAE